MGLEQSFDGESHVVLAVWPSNTRIKGDGADLEVSVGSERIRVGDNVDGGSERRDSFPSLTDLLPRDCSSLPATDFEPGG